MVAWRKGSTLLVRFQSYLAGSAFALLLAAQIAMQLLHAYPASEYLWHVNIIFAREVRPLLQHVDMLAGGPGAAVVAFGGLALLCILSARANLRLMAAANCHIALVMLVFLAAKSWTRTYPYGLPNHEPLVALATRLTVVQYGMAAFIVILAAVCVAIQVEMLGRGLGPRRRGAVAANSVPITRPPQREPG